MLRGNHLHNIRIDIKKPRMRIVPRQQCQQQLIEVVAGHQCVTGGHHVPALPLCRAKRANFGIATKRQMQWLKWQQDRSKTGTGSFRALGHQDNAPMVAGKDLQNQA